MTPMLGIMASQISGHLSSYDSIATVNLGASQTTITFSSIPQTYKHLQLRVNARSTRAVTLEGCWLYFNGDTSSTTTYDYHILIGNGTAASTASQTTPTTPGALANLIAGASATASIFGGGITDILDYTNTNKNKVLRSLGGSDLNGSGQIRFTSSMWINTSAITSITIDTQAGGDFVQYSSFALYGIKG